MSVRKVVACFFALLAARLSAAPPVSLETFPLCAHAHDDAGQIAGTTIVPVAWWALNDTAIVLEYPSVYSVHTSPNPNIPLRSQPGAFLAGSILDSLRCYVDSDAYDFVLMYSLVEVPGWIHSGPRGIQAPAKNIGLPNSQFGNPSAFAAWPRLLLAPHMNSVELMEPEGAEDFGVRSAMHEMGHAWNVFWAQESSGPLGWQPDDPLAWLGSCCSHWSWNWVDPQLPGMMYSAPTNPVFNDFDLYAMGLMPYEEALLAGYEIYEDSGSGPTGTPHTLTLDHLLASLALRGAEYSEGDGRRIPATDSSATDLSALIVILKGEGQTLTAAHEEAVDALATGLPPAWELATGGRSAITLEVFRSTPIDGDLDAVLDCTDNCPQESNASQANTDGDTLGDACDPCPHVAHPSFFDLDRVLPFTLRDLSIFQNCFSGTASAGAGCSFVDFAANGRIDLADYVPLGELLLGGCD